MTTTTRQLYLFMTAYSGNWKNSLYITCQDRTDNPGYLLASDRDGQPVIIYVQQFYQLTEVWIDPAECCGRLTEAGFESLYAQYLIWNCPSMEGRPLRQFHKPETTPA